MCYTSAKTKRAYGVKTNLAAQATGMSSEIKSKMDTEQRSRSDSEMMIPKPTHGRCFCMNSPVLHPFSSFLSPSLLPGPIKMSTSYDIKLSFSSGVEMLQFNYKCSDCRRKTEHGSSRKNSIADGNKGYLPGSWPRFSFLSLL